MPHKKCITLIESLGNIDTYLVGQSYVNNSPIWHDMSLESYRYIPQVEPYESLIRNHHINR